MNGIILAGMDFYQDASGGYRADGRDGYAVLLNGEPGGWVYSLLRDGSVLAQLKKTQLARFDMLILWSLERAGEREKAS